MTVPLLPLPPLRLQRRPTVSAEMGPVFPRVTADACLTCFTRVAGQEPVRQTEVLAVSRLTRETP